MPSDQWWGYSSHYGWVVLDRTRHQNGPEAMGALIFIRCDTRSEYQEERKAWIENYIFAGHYLDSLSGHAKHEAEQAVAAFKSHYPDILRDVETKAESDRLEREEARKLRVTEAFAQYRVDALWYLAPNDNLPSILAHGILSHNEVQEQNMDVVDISDPSVQRRRDSWEPCFHRAIHDYAPLYLNPRNPMLSKRRDAQGQICILQVSLNAILEAEFLFTNGNAASRNTGFFKDINDLDKVAWDVLRNDYWTDFEDGKRKRCTEVLVYPKVDRQHIVKVHVSPRNPMARRRDLAVPIEVTPTLFF